MKLDPAAWAQVLALLDEALEIPDAQREAWISARCPAADPQHAVLRQLLAERADIESGGFLQQIPAVDVASGNGARDFTPGGRIGPYRLVRELGQGGMASVWLAERADGAHSRPVALKLPFRGPSAHRLEERFLRERQILSTLTHPNIASVLDAGADGAQPWLAMEYVAGEPITEWADRHGLDVAGRLRLFLQVLRAAQHAHAQLVIHRDIKPGNVLVDAGGQVKLLDFGVAKLLGDESRSPGAELTQAGGRALTPQYASPEQVAGAPLGASSDVYSLGVLLYQLLAGRLPYQLKRDSPAALEEAILAAHIERPSAQVADPAARRALRGDIDTIVMHALAAQPLERYGSAESFAQDIERSLHSLPILARPSSAGYRMRKLVHRNRLAFGAGAVVALALIAGTAISVWQARAAQREARRAEAVQAFLTETLSFNEPDQANGRQMSARELLDLSASRIDTRFAADEATRAALHHTVGSIYVETGDFEQADPHLRRAIALYESTGQRGSRQHIEALFSLCETLDELAQYDAMREVVLRTQSEAGRAFGPRNIWSARLLAELAWADYHQGKTRGAIALAEQALALQRQLTGEASRDYLRISSVLVNFYNGSGNAERALALQEQAVRLGPRTADYSEGDRLMDRYNLARARFAMGDFHGLEPDLRALAPQLEKHFGARHDRSISTTALWAQTLARVGRFDEAVALQRGNLDRAMTRVPPDDELVALGRLQLALILKSAARYQAALDPAQQGMEYFDAQYSTPTNYRERARTILGEVLLGLGRRAEAEAALRAVIANVASLGDPKSAWAAEATLILAIAQRDAAAAANACPGVAAGAGSDSALAARCRTIEAWLAALAATPADRPAAFARFIAARDRLLPKLVAGQGLIAELKGMEAEALEPIDPRRAAALHVEARAAFENLFGRVPRAADLRILH